MRKSRAANFIPFQPVGADESDRFVPFESLHHHLQAVGKNVVVRLDDLAVAAGPGNLLQRSVVVPHLWKNARPPYQADSGVALRVLLGDFARSVRTAIVDEDVFEIRT